MRRGKFMFAAVLLIIGFVVLFETPGLAQTTQEQLVAQMEKQPVSIFTTAHYTWDFLTEMGKRFAESAKPVVIFNGGARIGGEVTFYEEKLFALTAGKYLKEEPGNPGAIEFEDGWFFGIEAKFPEWPKGTDIGELFSKLRPQILFHQGSWYFGLSYAFRNIVDG